MQTGTYVLALVLSVVGAASAVYLGQRSTRSWTAGFVASVVFGLITALGFRLTTGRLPPVPRPDHSTSAEPWELLALPLLVVACLWPLVRQLLLRTNAVRLWLAMVFASLPLLLSLPSGESYADVVPANANWAVLALLAIGTNFLSGEQLDASGAARWSLWVFVAQLFTVAALLMTCYGTLGEWCAIAALTLGVLAAGRVFLTEGAWSSALGLAATTLALTLLSHIRVYSTLALPYWLAPLPMLLPAIICAIDQTFVRGRPGWLRAMIAAAVAAIVSGLVVATVLSLGGPSDEQWSSLINGQFDNQSLVPAQAQRVS